MSLSTIEGAVYRLVGGRKLGFLDPTFLSIIAHLALGASDAACDSKAAASCRAACKMLSGMHPANRCFRLLHLTRSGDQVLRAC